MTALFVGFLLVAVASVGFGAALFLHRPAPQVATAAPSDRLARTAPPVPGPRSSPPPVAVPREIDERIIEEPDAGLADEPVAAIPSTQPLPFDAPSRSEPIVAPRRPVRTEPATPIRTPILVRVRSGLLLALCVVILAALLGAVLSAVAVAVGLLLS